MSDIIINKDCPVVTISVWTYNSSKFVLETLESIKNQTYLKLILQVCDDCSTDNTVHICKKWIENNKSRFVKTKIIVPEHNTGVSANANQSWDACETKYIKDIAGDDILLPNCIEEYMNFISVHPETIFLFSKVECFHSNNKNSPITKSLFDYSFFQLPACTKLDRLIVKGNCIPAASLFCNIHKIREIGLRHDERIPMLEDLPLWINAIKVGIDMLFVDKILVRYRVGLGISTTAQFPLSYIISCRLLHIYYVHPYWMERNPTKALDDLASHETHILRLYNELLNSKPIRFRNNIVTFVDKFLKFLR